MGSIAEMWENQGIEKGIEKEKFIIAKNMLKKGTDINFIASVTNLTVNQVISIKESLGK